MEAPGLRGGQPGWVAYAGYRDFLGVATFSCRSGEFGTVWRRLSEHSAGVGESRTGMSALLGSSLGSLQIKHGIDKSWALKRVGPWISLKEGIMVTH